MLLQIGGVKPGFQPPWRGTEVLNGKAGISAFSWSTRFVKEQCRFLPWFFFWLFITWFSFGKSEIHDSTKGLHFKAVCRSLEQMGGTWIELKPYCERWSLYSSLHFLNLLRGMFRRRGKGFKIPNSHPGSIISGVLPFLRGLYSRIQQIIKISPQNADHGTTIPVSAMQGMSPAFLPAPLLPFHCSSCLSLLGSPSVPLHSEAVRALSQHLNLVCSCSWSQRHAPGCCSHQKHGEEAGWEAGRGLSIPSHDSSPVGREGGCWLSGEQQQI